MPYLDFSSHSASAIFHPCITLVTCSPPNTWGSLRHYEGDKEMGDSRFACGHLTY